jgi:ABC-2 type transport system permease protein
VNQFQPLVAIARKDVESYYAKPPLITWGLLFPAVLLLALWVKDRAGYPDVIPGVIAMTLLFGTTSMAAIVITFEKRTGTLDRLLLAPLARPTILWGKAISATLYGLSTSLVLTVGLTLLLGIPIARPAFFAAGLLLGGVTFSMAGLAAAAMVREVFEAMALLNFFRFPLLFVSGVFLPLASMPDWLLPVAMASPLTHVVELLRMGLYGRTWFAAPWIPMAGLLAFLVAAWLVADFEFRRHVERA